MTTKSQPTKQQDAANSTTTTKTITEGSATMQFPATEETAVFYNPVQVQNRDLSILMIALHAERTGRPLTVLDALAASGLRSIRYWKELCNSTSSNMISHITINDLDPAATERAKQNIQANGVPTAERRDDTGIRVVTGDATRLMYNSRTSFGRKKTQVTELPKSAQSMDDMQWDVIDLDPYGSAAPFLDAAVQAVRHGGLLNVTCTDMIALGGAHPETCYGRYHSVPIQRGMHLQEMAVRILLYAIATTAGRYGRSMEPVLSVGMDFYVRVFVRITDHKAAVNDLSLNCGMVYQSMHCPSFHVLPHGQKGGKSGNVYQAARLKHGVCTETGCKFKIGGPIWLGPMHDRDTLNKALERLQQEPGTGGVPDTKYIKTKDRLQGLITSCIDELPNAPLYYKMGDLVKTVHLTVPPMLQFKSALVNAGYEVSGYHKEPEAIKTTAPSNVVWDVLRVWAKNHPPRKKQPEDSAAAKILAVEPTTNIDFTIVKSLRVSKSAVARFPMNPEAHWGPKQRATGKRKAENEDAKTESQKVKVESQDEAAKSN